MAIDITLLCLSQDGYLDQTRPLLQKKKGAIIDVFPIGKLQPQNHPFFTVDVTETQYSTISEARIDLLIHEYDVNGDIVRPNIVIMNEAAATAQELQALASDRRISVARADMQRLYGRG